MAYELIIAEKPMAAKKIADAIAKGKPIKNTKNKVSHFEITTEDGNDVIVCAAVGHLYSLKEVKKEKGWNYPVFSIAWGEAHNIQKAAKFTKKYLDEIKKLAKKADSFTIATDVDIEGEVIGYNVLRFACKQKDAHRMFFSTLTPDELKESYQKKQKTLNWGMAYAGETRHILDWYWGINLSRALTLAVKRVRKGFKLLTTGRVQGPALKLIVDKEKDIKAFIPVPYWQLIAHGKEKDFVIEALHKEDKFWEEDKAGKIHKKIKNEKKGTISEIKRRESKQKPPVPFDLTSLQTEAHKLFGINPNRTLQIAQNLYTNSYISYPRTSSQKLPSKIGFIKILKQLAKYEKYTVLAEELFKLKKLEPHEGKKEDVAHPAIYPTGVIPKKLEGQDAKLYDLIVKRFFAVFGEPALRESMTVTISIKDEPFLVEGKRTVEEGWHKFYHPYVKLEEVTLPDFKKGKDTEIKKIDKLRKETTPPKRYTQSSIIKDLDKRNLGTKATRAAIIDTLYNRDYIIGDKIEATVLGISTIETLEKYANEIVDEHLTRHFEVEVEAIQEKKSKPEDVLDEAKKVLKKMLKSFKDHEEEIGIALSESEHISYERTHTLGPCHNCNEGHLMIRKSRFGLFVGCSGYPECKTTYNLPKQAVVKPAHRQCEHCNHPVVLVKPIKRRERETCINPKCITWTPEYQKKLEDEREKQKMKAAQEE